jgi:hypothetical protein
LEKGHTVLKTEEEYGIELVVFTHDANGFVEEGNIYIQLKATDAPALSADGTYFSFSISTRDYNAWDIEPMPVILILYDAKRDKAHWQYVQGYFAGIHQGDRRLVPSQSQLEFPLTTCLTRRPWITVARKN